MLQSDKHWVKSIDWTNGVTSQGQTNAVVGLSVGQMLFGQILVGQTLVG